MIRSYKEPHPPARSITDVFRKRWGSNGRTIRRGLADRIITALVSTPAGPNPPTSADPDLREIVESPSCIYPSSLDANVDDLRRLLFVQLDQHPETVAETIHMAWSRFDELDHAALQKSRFRGPELALIILAVVAAVLAILTAASNVPADIGKAP
ncbi:MAG: hypothetical protein JO033_04900 [Acidobacteriaceae bacterium]|nr:hypothetical protein [Acidobacteriaceae bacterium]